MPFLGFEYTSAVKPHSMTCNDKNHIFIDLHSSFTIYFISIMTPFHYSGSFVVFLFCCCCFFPRHYVALIIKVLLYKRTLCGTYYKTIFTIMERNNTALKRNRLGDNDKTCQRVND